MPPAVYSPVGALRSVLYAAANDTGGWGYFPRKLSRLEPTCWTLLALGAAGADRASLARHTDWLMRVQQTNGWLVEEPTWPVNIAFNALTAFVWFSADTAIDDGRRRLLDALVGSKGVQAENDPHPLQDNRLQGWPWTDGTFSWVEPTAWGLLALKKARNAGLGTPALASRIDEAERLLIDRVCQSGGWNFGNAVTMEQDLRPYVPTTALGLLALQDRPTQPSVSQSLAYLQDHWADEISAPALALSLLCLDVFGRPTAPVARRLEAHAPRAEAFGNICGEAMALFSLSARGHRHAFRL